MHSWLNGYPLITNPIPGYQQLTPFSSRAWTIARVLISLLPLHPHLPRPSKRQLLVGGDSPKLNDLLQACECHLLQDRIKLLGPIRHPEAHNACFAPFPSRIFIPTPSVFLALTRSSSADPSSSTPLTESNGIAILQETCTGFYVVSTPVGEVREILPEDMISFMYPDEDDLFPVLFEAIDTGPNPLREYAQVEQYYDWERVAERAETIYHTVMRSEPIYFEARLERMMNLGRFAGMIDITILIIFPLSRVVDAKYDMDFVRERWKFDVFSELACAVQETPSHPGLDGDT